LFGLLFLLAACGSSLPDGGPAQSIHPQPQPNDGGVRITAPCTATACGAAPSNLGSPRCKPEAAGCGWSDDTAVSFRQCAESECGAAPGADVCPAGTTFRGNTCGSENESVCTWSTACAPPPSTVPCRDAEGCGGKPELGVICSDGSAGDLVCMQFASRCAWQRTCE